MKRLVAFELPNSLSVEERHYIGLSSLKSAFIIREDKVIVSIIKDYMLQNNQIMFEITVEDPHLEEMLDSGDPDHRYIWLNPIESMLGLLN